MPRIPQMETRLTPAQTAALLTINPRTLRRWSGKFSKALSDTARAKSKKRYYTGSDVEILQTAQVYLSEGKNLKEVAELLPEAEVISTSTALTLSPEQNIVLGEVRERTKHLGHVSQDHGQRIELLEKELAFLRWKSMPFWKRYNTPPPA